MIEFLEAKFREMKKVKNGQIVDSTTNAKRYKYLLRVLQQFTKEKYNKAFSTYFFADINEQLTPMWLPKWRVNGLPGAKKTAGYVPRFSFWQIITLYKVQN